jgi:hypothetical protein
LEEVHRKETKIEFSFETYGNKNKKERVNESYSIFTNERGT